MPMDLGIYIRGLKATHFVCVVKAEGDLAAILSVGRKNTEYESAKEIFKDQVRRLKRDDPQQYTLEFYA